MALDELGDDYQLLILDNSVDFSGNEERVVDFVDKNFLKDRSTFFSFRKNLGFAKGFNFLINQAISIDADLFVAINPDTILNKKSIFNLVEGLKGTDEGQKIASLSPKILHWDFLNNKKTEIIDSLGIGISKYHRFFDIEQGNVDCQRAGGEIFGSSGAAVIYSLKALKDVAFDNGQGLEFFDELMFMYKEDVDLSYRLRLAGYKSFLEPRAVIYHDRALSSSSFSLWSLIFGKKQHFRSVSFLNQLIILLKFKKIKFSPKIRFGYYIRFCFLIVYGLLFEFKQIKTVTKIAPKVREKREALKIGSCGVQGIEKMIKV